jgi:putative flippase GtrA
MMGIGRWERMRDIRQLTIEVGRIIRFGIVGVGAALVYAAVTALAVESGVASPVVASVAGHLVAGLISYFGHLHFSFAVNPDHQVFAWRFVVIALITIAMNVGVTFLLTTVLGMSYRVAVLVVMVLIPLTNYLCNRFWVFHPGLEPLSTAGPT